MASKIPYEDIIDKLSEDEEFMSLPEAEQDALIEEIAQERYGKVPGTENFLERAINAVQGADQTMAKGIGENISEVPAATATMGPMGAGTALGGVKGLEDVMPSTMQFAGNLTGNAYGLLKYGAPNRGAAVGGTLGRAIGETGRQGVKAIRGEGFDAGEIGKQTAIAGASEALAMPFGFVTNKMLGGPAGAEFRGKTGAQLGALKNQIRKQGGHLYADDVVKEIRDAVDKLGQNVQADPRISKALSTLADDIEQVGLSKGNLLDQEDIMRATRRLDLELKNVGVFGDKVPKSFPEAGVMGEVRGNLKQRTRDAAGRIGIGKEYDQANDVYAKISRGYPQKNSKHQLLKTLLEASGIQDVMAGNIGGAMGNILASESVGNNALMKGIYNTLKIGKAVPTAVSELISQGTKSRKSA